MDTVGWSSRIAQLTAFAALDEALRAKLAGVFLGVSEREEIPEGTVLFTQGEEGSEAGYVVLEGVVLVEKSNAGPIRCAAPALIGEMNQFNPVHFRTATVTAATPLEALRFSWKDFEGALYDALGRTEADAVQEALRGQAWQHFME